MPGNGGWPFFVLGTALLWAGLRQRLRCLLPPDEWRKLRIGLWWMLAVPTLLTLLVMAAGCAPAPAPAQVPIVQTMPAVPRPQRPAFVAFEDGDFAACSAAARRRLLQRHAQVVWYLRELETALDAWEAQGRRPGHDG